MSAGLDYPGVGPEHAWLKDNGRAQYVTITDDEALAAFRRMLPHRGHHSRRSSRRTRSPTRRKLAPTLPRDKVLLVNLSGRGDKDMNTVAERTGLKFSMPDEWHVAPLTVRLNRIDATFAKLRAAGRTALIPYVTTGDPSLAATVAADARAGRRRRRRDRARRPVLRSDGRRPGDPARVRARACAAASASSDVLDRRRGVSQRRTRRRRSC